MEFEDYILLGFKGLIYFIIFLIIIGFIGIHINTGKGEHVGIVTAVEKTGIIWKTGTAYIKTDKQSSQEDEYCVIDSTVYTDLQEFAETSEKVKISYYSYLVTAWYECGMEGGIISNVEPIK